MSHEPGLEQLKFIETILGFGYGPFIGPGGNVLDGLC